MSTVDVDVLVAGAGVIGLACARAFALKGLDVLVVEPYGHIGEETSSRNSEVIHAGIYYPQNSLKARSCVRGKALLYEFCASHQVPHQRCGKLIVASTEAQRTTLASYREQARNNGVGELEWLSETDIARLEPEVRAVVGLWSESTGIIDSHAYMLALQADLEAAGGVIAFHTELVAAVPSDAAATELVTLRDGDGHEHRLRCRWLVNAAGLSAPQLARACAPEHAARLPAAHYAKGHYYTYSSRQPPFRHLVYPIAESAGLGVHVTLDLQGQVRFGPDVQWLAQPDYAFDFSRKAEFVRAIRQYFPGLDEDRLQPGYTGIRPKISPAGAPAADFLVLGPEALNGRRQLHMLGIESPGLTASLALAELATEQLRL